MLLLRQRDFEQYGIGYKEHDDQPAIALQKPTKLNINSTPASDRFLGPYPNYKKNHNVFLSFCKIIIDLPQI